MSTAFDAMINEQVAFLNEKGVANKLVEYDNVIDMTRSRMMWLLDKAGSYTIPQIQNGLKVSLNAAAAIDEHRTAYTNIKAAIDAEVAAGRIPSGQTNITGLFG